MTLFCAVGLPFSQQQPAPLQQQPAPLHELLAPPLQQLLSLQQQLSLQQLIQETSFYRRLLQIR